MKTKNKITKICTSKKIKKINSNLEFKSIDLLKFSYVISADIKRTNDGIRLYEKLRKQLQRAKRRFAKTGNSAFVKKDLEHFRRKNREKFRRFWLKKKMTSKQTAQTIKPTKRIVKNNQLPPPLHSALTKSSKRLFFKNKALRDDPPKFKDKRLKHRDTKFVPSLESLLYRAPKVVQETFKNQERPLHTKVYV